MMFRATSISDTNTDAVKKQKKAEYERQYAKKINVTRQKINVTYIIALYFQAVHNINTVKS